MSASRSIPVSAPALVGNEEAYVLDCLRTTWISSNGEYIRRFEGAFGEFCGVRHALSCTNGTVALHLALLALGVGPGDEVLVPTLTYIATANAVTYCGARPVFVDVEPETWNLDPSLLEAQITARTKGIIVVHLYGHPVDMDPVVAIARKHNLFVVEDAAEAHGAQYRARPVGSLADVATFSFYGNKILTTGEGGMVVTDDDHLATRIRHLKGQGMDPDRRYWFTAVGYNYRMTNIAAAIGLAQLEKAQWHIRRRREVASWYREDLARIPGIVWQAEKPWARHAYWMVALRLSEDNPPRDDVIERLRHEGVETRPVFYPIHTLPPYREKADGLAFPVAEGIARHGINVPTWAGLTRDDVRYVSSKLQALLKR